MLVGVISTDDSIAQRARELSALAHLLDQQRIREAFAAKLSPVAV